MSGGIPDTIKIGLDPSVFSPSDFDNVNTETRLDGLEKETVHSVMYLSNGDVSRYNGDQALKERVIYRDDNGNIHKKNDNIFIIRDSIVCKEFNKVVTTRIVDADTKRSSRLPLTELKKRFTHLPMISITFKKKFPKMLIKFFEYGTTLMIFPTESVVETGGNTDNKEAGAMAAALQYFKAAGYNLEVESTVVTNIVATGSHLGPYINLEALNHWGEYNSEYNPRKFPAVIMSIGDKVTVLVFSSGRIVSVGAEHQREWINAFIKLSGGINWAMNRPPQKLITPKKRKALSNVDKKEKKKMKK